eukprot:8067625-Alexandrium_andersonii.AAC.1
MCERACARAACAVAQEASVTDRIKTAVMGGLGETRHRGWMEADAADGKRCRTKRDTGNYILLHGGCKPQAPSRGASQCQTPARREPASTTHSASQACPLTTAPTPRPRSPRNQCGSPRRRA